MPCTSGVTKLLKRQTRVHNHHWTAATGAVKTVLSAGLCFWNAVVSSSIGSFSDAYRWSFVALHPAVWRRAGQLAGKRSPGSCEALPRYKVPPAASGYRVTQLRVQARRIWVTKTGHDHAEPRTSSCQQYTVRPNFATMPRDPKPMMSG